MASVDSSAQTSSAQTSSAQTSSAQTSSDQTSSDQTSSDQTSWAQTSWAQTSWARNFWSQGSGRPSLAGYEAGTRQMSWENQPYNLQLGPTRFSFSSDFATVFNDNTNLSQNGPQSDIILEPTLHLDGVWPVTTLNTLNLNLGLGYVGYMIHNNQPGSNTVAVDPGSDVNFDVFIDDHLRLNFHDQFFVSYNPVEEATLSNVRDFGRFENTSGVTATWDMNALILRTTYDHFNYVSLTDQFDYLNRNAEIFTPSISYAVTDATVAGLDTSVMYSYYNQNFLNDSTMLSTGPWVEIALDRFVKLRASAGYQGGYFDQGGGNGDTSDLTGWFGNLSIAHLLNSSMTETLAGGHESQLGLNTNYETVDYIRYTISSSAIRAVSTSLYGFYEHVEDSPDFLSETADRFGFGIHLGHSLSSRANIGLDYQFIKKNSNLPNSDYTQNQVTATITYQF